MKKVPVSFWIITSIALVWNAMGVFQYLSQAFNTESFRAQYNEEQLALLSIQPTWVTIAFGMGVFGGFLGCISLLLRKKWAINLFLLSVLGVMAQMYYNLMIIKSVAIYGPSAVIMTFMILGIALFLLWYTKKATNEGWLN